MDLKEFLKPSWKKVGVLILAYVLLMPPVLLCLIPPRASSGGSYTSCQTLLEIIIANPIAFFVHATITLPIIAIQYIPWSVLFALAAYLLACTLVHLLDKKAGKPQGKMLTKKISE